MKATAESDRHKDLDARQGALTTHEIEHRTLGASVTPRRVKVMPRDQPDAPYVGLEHIEPHTMKLLGTVPAGTMKSAGNRFFAGDVLYSRLRPYLNKVWLADRDGICSGEFIVLPPPPDIEPAWLAYRLHSQDFVHFANSLNAGDRPRVDFDQLSSFPFLLPSSLATQRSVVAKLDEQFSRLDAGVAALRRAQASLKRYRASVLKAACEGRLVPTEAELARQEGRTYETGEQLLTRILETRRASWSGKGKYKDPTPPDTTNLPELPEGWVWASVEQLSDVVRGASPRPAGDPRYFGGDIPWITVGPLTGGTSPYLTTVDTTLNEAGRSQSRYIEPHTLLLTNSGATLGVPKITLIGGCINDGVAALLGVGYPLKLYLYYYLGTLTDTLRRVNQGAAQPNLNTTIIKALTVPLPPRDEQERIVAEVQRHLSVGDATQAMLAGNFRRAGNLRRATLCKGFELGQESN